MIVKLKHEKHGFHHVYSVEDLAKCKANGWVEVDAPAELAASTEIEAQEEPKRRGRPRKTEE